MGSPPRMRGKERGSVRSSYFARITPAYAGKRGSGSLPRSCRRDHPRVCGEKHTAQRATVPGVGSPPRVRGKDSFTPEAMQADRITPACAGKRRRCCRYRQGAWDHPRACGEKLIQAPFCVLGTGSPPRVRGKVECFADEQHLTGITPARAGKSFQQVFPAITSRDHPRAGGEKWF